MNYKNIFIVSVLVIGIISAFILMPKSIGNTGKIIAKSMPTNPENREEIKTLRIAGSTTVLPIAQKAAEKYMKEYSNVNIEISGGGSSVGIKSVGEGTADIGAASRSAKPGEIERYGLVDHVIAKDGIAIIVHPTNPIKSLTGEQIKKIYDGTYSNWKELNGPDMEIVIVNRDSNSGTREFFQNHVMNKEDFRNDAKIIEKNSNGAVKQTVSQIPASIGYVGLGYVDNSVKALKINVNENLIEPTIDNVKNGIYPISRSLHMYTKTKATGIAKDFIDFILSSEGQEIVTEENFVSL